MYYHIVYSLEVLKETGVRAGRALSAKGLVGFASVDVVFFDNPAFDVTLLEEEHTYIYIYIYMYILYTYTYMYVDTVCIANFH